MTRRVMTSTVASRRDSTLGSPASCGITGTDTGVQTGADSCIVASDSTARRSTVTSVGSADSGGLTASCGSLNGSTPSSKALPGNSLDRPWLASGGNSVAIDGTGDACNVPVPIGASSLVTSGTSGTYQGPPAAWRGGCCASGASCHWGSTTTDAGGSACSGADSAGPSSSGNAESGWPTLGSSSGTTLGISSAGISSAGNSFRGNSPSSLHLGSRSSCSHGSAHSESTGGKRCIDSTVTGASASTPGSRLISASVSPCSASAWGAGGSGNVDTSR